MTHRQSHIQKVSRAAGTRGAGLERFARNVLPAAIRRIGAMIGSSTRAAASISSMGVWKLCVAASAAACAAGFSSLIQPVSTAVM